MWQVCQSAGIDHDEVATTVAPLGRGLVQPDVRHPRRRARTAACACPKDTIGFLGFASERSVPMPLVEAV